MTWVLDNLPLIWERTLAHVATSIPPIVLSLLLSLPLGWLAHRYRASRALVLGGAGLLYAIPSLPLFIVLPLVVGTGARDVANVVIALTLYGIALMVRYVAEGLDSVPREAVQAATAMGYPPARRVLTVQLPLAGPVLVAGLRVVSASTISLVTVGAVLGIPSLGLLFVDGFQRGILAEILTGIVATVLLALLFDWALVLLGRLVMPWTSADLQRRGRGGGRGRGRGRGRAVWSRRQPSPAEVEATP